MQEQDSPNNLKKLIAYCKASISLSINEHRDAYECVEDYLRTSMQDDMTGEIKPDVLQKMIELDTCIELQFYPLTPIGFYMVYHFDVDEAINEAISLIEGKLKENPLYLKDFV